MDKMSDMSLYDKDLIEYILSLNLESIKPPAEQIHQTFDLNGEKSYPLYGDESGLTYDYWGS